MRKQCVPGSFLPAHAREPGNEASILAATVITLNVFPSHFLHICFLILFFLLCIQFENDFAPLLASAHTQ